MALRILQLGIVFAIGLRQGPAAQRAWGLNLPNIPLSIQLEDPEDVTVARGQNVSLRCGVRSSLPVRISWFHNGVLLEVNDTKREQLEDGTLFIPRIAGKKSSGVVGEYSCLAANSKGAVLSNPAKLRVAAIDKEFKEESGNISVTELQPAVLPCNIHSVPVAEVEWQFNNLPLNPSTRYVPLPSGALLITKTAQSDAGVYRCTATNPVLKKSVYSKNIELVLSPNEGVPEKPTFIPLTGLNQTVIFGEDLKLFCAASGWPIPQVQWLNNQSIVGNTSVLHLRAVSLTAAGSYTCKAANTEGVSNQIYNVEVFQKPYFNITPVSKIYPSAKTVRLHCQALGFPEPRVIWLKNGSPIKSEARIIKKQGLLFSHTFSHDAGIYQCVAINSVGRAWTAAQVAINDSDKPDPPQNVHCRNFNETSICLTWQAPSNVSIQAYTIYSLYKEHDMEVSGPDFLINNTYQLVTGLNDSTNYSFYVRLYSNVASDSSERVSCRTGITGSRNLQIQQIKGENVLLTWYEISTDVSCDGHRALYKVQWKKGDSFPYTERTKKLKYTISGLIPDVEYEFRVVSSSYEDDSAWVKFTLTSSIPKNITIAGKDEVRNKVVKHLEGKLVSTSTVMLNWTAPADSIKHYSVCYTISKENPDCKHGKIIKSSNNFLKISTLQPNSGYEFRVKVHRLDGSSGPFSHALEIKTPPEVPSSVLGLTQKVVNDSTICLRWQAPLKPFGRLLRYNIYYSIDANKPLEKWINFSVPAHQRQTNACLLGDENSVSTYLKNLKSNMQYFVYIRAVSDVGPGSPSSLIKVSTNSTVQVEVNFNDRQNDTQVDLRQKQKMGLIVGLILAFVCIVWCITCILLRRRCVKRSARRMYNKNSEPAAHYASHGSSVHVRLEDPCFAEAHEVQQLVGEEQTRIAPTEGPNLDRKNCEEFPNGHLNGSVKPQGNGHLANGHVHITENPQFFAFDCNGHSGSQFPKESLSEDSNSNLQTSKFYELYRLFENAKKNKAYDCNRIAKSHSLNSCEEDSLNSTQLTQLEESISASIQKPVPILNPNG